MLKAVVERTNNFFTVQGSICVADSVTVGSWGQVVIRDPKILRVNGQDIASSVTNSAFLLVKSEK